MIWDGNDLSHLFKVELPITRSIIPEIEASTTQVGGRAGSVFGSVHLGALELGVPIRLIAPSKHMVDFERLRRKVAGALYRDRMCKLVLDDAPDVWYWAVLQGSNELDMFAETGGTELQFLCPEPYAHGRKTTRVSNGGSISVNVGGNYKTAPVVKVYSGGTTVSVNFDGALFQTDGNAAQYAEVDAVNHMVTDADGTPVQIEITSDWPIWEPGVHTVRCQKRFEVTWEELWL